MLKIQSSTRGKNSVPFVIFRKDHLLFGITCFPVWGSFAVGGHLHRCTVAPSDCPQLPSYIFNKVVRALVRFTQLGSQFTLTTVLVQYWSLWGCFHVRCLYCYPLVSFPMRVNLIGSQLLTWYGWDSASICPDSIIPFSQRYHVRAQYPLSTTRKLTHFVGKIISMGFVWEHHPFWYLS